MDTKTTKIFFLALSVAALSSCSTAYKMGQTPDDVYYSPARERAAAANQDQYVESAPNPQRYSGAQRANRYDSYQDFDSYRNDRFLRMSIGSPMRLSAFDDYYMYDGYSNWKYNNYAYNWNTPWNSYYYWNSYYNPYNTFNFYSPYYYSGYGNYGGSYGGGVIVSPKTTINSTLRPRPFNPGSYSNNSYNNNNLYLDRNSAVRPTTSNSVNSGNRYNNRNFYYNNSNSGSTMRRLPSSSSDNNTYYNSNSRSNNSYSAPTRSYEAPTRSYTPSSSGSSGGGSSSSGGSSGGVSRPGRGN